MKHSIWTIAISHMFIEIFFLMHLALIPVFLKEFNLTLVEASLIVTVPTSLGLLTNVSSGFLVDRIGPKPILVCGMMLQAIGGFVVASSWDIMSLLSGASCIGIASSFYHNSGLSIISKDLKKYELSKGMGFHSAMGSVGTTMGLLTLPIMLTYYNWRLAYIIWTIPILFWAFNLMRIRLRSINLPERTKVRSARSILSKDFVSFLIAMGFRQSGAIIIVTFITTYMVLLRDLSEVTSSLIFAIGPPMGIFSSLISGYLGYSLGNKKVLILVMVGAMFSVAFMHFAPTTLLLVLIFLCFMFFNQAVWAPLASITATLTPSNRRGLGYSLSMSSQQAIIAVSPLLAAKLIEDSSLLIMFPLSVALIFISIVIFILPSWNRYSSVIEIMNK